jgi:hypothetical protein
MSKPDIRTLATVSELDFFLVAMTDKTRVAKDKSASLTRGSAWYCEEFRKRVSKSRRCSGAVLGRNRVRTEGDDDKSELIESCNAENLETLIFNLKVKSGCCTRHLHCNLWGA